MRAGREGGADHRAGGRERRAKSPAKCEYQVPQGAHARPALFHSGRRHHHQLTEFRQIHRRPAEVDPRNCISAVNNLRANTKAYVRVWRPEPAYQLEGDDFPDPPPSVALILAGSQSALGGITQTRNSKMAELEIGAGDSVITGSKTIQVEVKE